MGEQIRENAARAKPRKVLGLVALVSLLNVVFLAGLALGQGLDIGGGSGFHQHLACRLVQTGKSPSAMNSYGTIRIINVHAGVQEHGTSPSDSCTSEEQYIRVTIDHEVGAHP